MNILIIYNFLKHESFFFLRTYFFHLVTLIYTLSFAFGFIVFESFYTVLKNLIRLSKKQNKTSLYLAGD